MLNELRNLSKSNLKYIDYIDIFNQMQKLHNNDIKLKNINIAVLRSFTCEQLREILTVEAFKENYFCDVFIGGYNQYFQEILNDESQLYKNNPDIIIMAIRLEDIYPELYYNYVYSHEELKELKKKVINTFEKLILKIEEESKASILINNFMIPVYAYSSLCDFQNRDGHINFIRNLNLSLLELSHKYKRVYIVDTEFIAANLGKNNILDKKMWYISKNPYKVEFYMELSKTYIKYIKAIKGNRKKCIVLDLDNTIWGGIVGEDGFNGIKLGNDYPGNCYKEFQKELIKLKNRGIILAINSKNNYADAIKVINEHPDMILREGDFSCIKINWEDKASNLQAIANELNIGIDSMVFIDDNPVECNLIEQAFNNEVVVINISSNPIEYVEMINSLNYFETLNITDEDLKKTEIYTSQIKREELKKSCIDLESYYKSLQMIVQIKEADDFSIPRIAQLTQKTNQFNMTTKRYTEDDIVHMVNDKRYKVYYIKVKDKFGDNGIVGVCIIEMESNVWYIDTFLLSCRVMKRNIEVAFMNYIFNSAKYNNVNIIMGKYICTKKNVESRHFYKNMGFINQGGDVFKLDVNSNKIECPSYIQIIE